MAASGYTPIQLYRSATASAAPLAANLSSGELALNYNSADMTLYAKNSGGTVKRIMNNPSGLKYPVFDGTPGAVLMTDGSGNLEFNLNQNAIINSLTVGGNTNGSIIFGIDALYTNPSAVNIAALGSNALYLNSSGADNIAVGYSALYNNTTGSNNIGIGSNALITNSTGSDNVVLGYNAGYSATGSGNVALGSSSLYANTGSHNIGIGESTLYASGTGSSNIAIGRNVLTALFDASYNVGIGDYALYKATSNAGNVAIGQNALYEASSGVATFTIYNAGSGYTDGYYPNSTLTYLGGPTFATAPTANILVSGGHVVSVTLVTSGTGFKGTSTQLSAALSGGSGFGIVVTALISASNNVGIGSNTLYNNKWGETNVAIGKQALYTNNNGDLNIAIGDQAMYLNTTGSQNVALGSSALYSNTTGFYNTAIGNLAAYFNTTGQHNVAIGLEALRYNSTGSHNIALGYHALYNTTGSNNIAIGNNVGADVTTGSGNVLIGDFLPASPYASSSGNIAISNGSSNVAAIVYDSGLDLWYIRNNTTVVPPLTINSSGNVGIGTLSPTVKLDIGSSTALAIQASLTSGTSDSNFHLYAVNGATGTAAGTEVARFGVGYGGNASTSFSSGFSFIRGASTTDGSLAILTNASERMRIDSSGNIGIGITLPTTKLDVNGGIKTNTGVVTVGSGLGGSYVYLDGYGAPLVAEALDGNAYSAFFTNNSAGPYYGFGVYVADTGQSFIYGGDGSGGITGVLGYDPASGITQLGTIIYLNNLNGRVGIGTALPSKKLDVNGDALINGITVGLGGGSLSTNTAVGTSALNALASGTSNTAIGYQAAYLANGVSSCTAVGRGALTNGGTSSTAVGRSALTVAASAQCTAVGSNAGQAVTTGGQNTFFGYSAGYTTTDGAGNVIIGSSAAASGASGSNQVVIGPTCTGVGDNYVTIGTSGTNNIYAQFNTSATWTKASDERIKRNIQSSNLGLSFINKLRPVTFQWKANTEYPTNIIGYDKDNNTQNLDAVMHGMIAQEVKAALDSEGVEHFAGWHERQSDGLQGVSNEMFVLPLINAVKELKAELDALKAELQALKGN